MIICSCHVVSDHEVRDAAAALGSTFTMPQVYRHLGREPQCGRCARAIRRIMLAEGETKVIPAV
jgi:bacterioferritin-associated ferredoxin